MIRFKSIKHPPTEDGTYLVITANEGGGLNIYEAIYRRRLYVQWSLDGRPPEIFPIYWAEGHLKTLKASWNVIELSLFP